jgi:hypothetical protein
MGTHLVKVLAPQFEFLAHIKQHEVNLRAFSHPAAGR